MMPDSNRQRRPVTVDCPPAIPDELIITEILRRSISDAEDGKWIGRCRCVSKSWRHHLSAPSLIRRKLFLPRFDRQIMIAHYDTSSRSSVYSLHSPDALQPLLPNSSNELPSTTTNSGEGLFKYGDGGSKVVQIAACCNGLFCISVEEKIRYSQLYRGLILWNPATSEAKVLPPSRHYYDHVDDDGDGYDPDVSLQAVGFGFDAETNDYKIVRQVEAGEYGSNPDHPCATEVYSLRNDSWRDIDDGSDPHLWKEQIAGCHKGKLYWWDWDLQEESSLLVFDWFDISREEFGKVELPCPPGGLEDNVNGSHHCLMAEEEEAMVVVFPTTSSWEVWMLLKRWVPESWVKLFVVVAAPPAMLAVDSVLLSRSLMCFFVAKMMIDSNSGGGDDEHTTDVFDLEMGGFDNLEAMVKWSLRIMIYVPSQISLKDYHI